MQIVSTKDSKLSHLEVYFVRLFQNKAFCVDIFE